MNLNDTTVVNRVCNLATRTICIAVVIIVLAEVKTNQLSELDQIISWCCSFGTLSQFHRQF